MALSPTSSHGSSSSSTSSAKIYDFTITGADQAAIDTFVDNGGLGVGVLLPTTYAALEIFLFSRTDDAGGLPTLFMRFNNDSGATYDKEAARDINAAYSGGPGAGSTGFTVYSRGTGGSANAFATAHIRIPSYANTTQHKSANMDCGAVDAVAGNSLVEASVLRWRSTSALSRVAFTPQTAAKKLLVDSRLVILVY